MIAQQLIKIDKKNLKTKMRYKLMKYLFILLFIIFFVDKLTSISNANTKITWENIKSIEDVKNSEKRLLNLWAIANNCYKFLKKSQYSSSIIPLWEDINTNWNLYKSEKKNLETVNLIEKDLFKIINLGIGIIITNNSEISNDFKKIIYDKRCKSPFAYPDYN
jgi:hypothetical protein